MEQHHIISDKKINLKRIKRILSGKLKLKLSQESIEKIQKCRTYLDQKIADSSDPIYGINTGFGALYHKEISSADLGTLQINLLKSHAAGTGEEVPYPIVKLMLLLKIQSLSYGHSGVHVSTVERLIDFFNHGIYPVVYEIGSLGASGDLAPLAHLSLPLIGLGEVHYQGEKMTGEAILKKMNWKPLEIKAKEGLALLNGTQFMGAYGVWCLLHAQRILQLADIIGAISLEAFNGSLEPFDELVNQIRPQPGQIDTAKRIRDLIKGSEIMDQPKKHIQDPYSFRCIPQVHGASKDAIRYTYKIFINEINCVTDNPNLFPDQDRIISGGNFHGQPLALALDFLCIALAELGNISERRTYQLVSGARGLPDFLVANPGLNSGLMIPQYSAAALVSQNKQLCTPASVDSIDSSAGQEDHVSMGANAALKAHQVVNNLYSILGIEFLTASQAMYFRHPLKTSPYLEEFLGNFKKVVSFIDHDRVFHKDIQASVNFLKNCSLD